jgi:putative transposase
MLTMTNEFAKKCWTMHRTRRIRAIQVIEQLANAMMIQSIPEYIPRDDNPEFITKDLLSWLSGIGVKNTYIEPGSPRENGFCKSFNITFRGNLFGWKNLLQLEGSTGHRWGLDQAL